MDLFPKLLSLNKLFFISARGAARRGNPFSLFFKKRFNIVRTEQPEISNREIMKVVATEYHNLSADEKEKLREEYWQLPKKEPSGERHISLKVAYEFAKSKGYPSYPPISTFNLFTRDFVKNSPKKITGKDIVIQSALAWKNVDPAEKEEYKTQLAKEKVIRRMKYLDWVCNQGFSGTLAEPTVLRKFYRRWHPEDFRYKKKEEQFSFKVFHKS